MARLFGEVNVFSDEEKETFGLKKNYYFPTEIKIGEKGFLAEVQQSRFGGNHYWNKVSLDGKTLTMFTPQKIEGKVSIVFV